MVNNDQLLLLEDSVEAWNDWREAYPLVKIDFRETDLRKADLRKANLKGVDLRNADLNFAQLSLTVLVGQC